MLTCLYQLQRFFVPGSVFTCLHMLVLCLYIAVLANLALPAVESRPLLIAGSASGRRGAGGRGPRGASTARRGSRRGVTRTGVAGRGMKLGATKTEKPLTEETFDF